MELGYFGNLTTITSSGDADGDDSPDAAELGNMTNPLDPGDSLRITAFLPAPGFNAANNPLFDVTVNSGLGRIASVGSTGRRGRWSAAKV
jgi:hypothetical protein